MKDFGGQIVELAQEILKIGRVERLKVKAHNHPYQSTIADHTEVLVQSVLFNRLINFE